MEDKIFSILTWKIRRNARREQTKSRLFIKYGIKYYYVEGQNTFDTDDGILYNIIIQHIIHIITNDDISQYISKIPGRNNIPIDGAQRTTTMNITLHKILSSAKDAILAYEAGELGPYNIYDTYQSLGPIPHESYDIYGNIDDVDTASELNASLCSGDTRFELLNTVYTTINTSLQLQDHIKQYNAHDDSLYNILQEHEHELYSDYVCFCKAKDTYPNQIPELTTIHINKWLSSKYYTSMSLALGLLGG